jgi:hypothetical protein
MEMRRLNELLSKEAGENDPGIEATKVAPWVTLARVLLNLDETITRE